MKYDSVCHLNGIKVDVHIFKSSCLHELQHHLGAACKKLPLVCLWQPMERENGGQELPPGCKL